MATISVVMPVYNTAVPFLQESIDSILNQTLRDFEFIIIDDASTNDAKEYLDGLTDPRIRLIRNETNIGITKSLNIGFKAARGKYIARMDGDDVSFPERFEKQVTFMESHPDVIVCGTKTVDYGEPVPETAGTIEDREYYRVRMLFRNPGPTHSTAFFDREKLIRYQLEYDERLIYAEDYGMWVSIIQYGDICVVPEVLLHYRKHSNQISKAHREMEIQCDKITQKKLLEQLLGSVTEEELELHYVHSTGYYKNAHIDAQIVRWYKRIIKANDHLEIYDQRTLIRYIQRIKRDLIFQTLGKNYSQVRKIILYCCYMSPVEIAREIRIALKKKERSLNHSCNNT